MLGPAWRRISLLALAMTQLSCPAAAEAPTVVVSIKPVHALVAAVMLGVGEPTVLVAGAAPPHGYALKPSEARRIARADVVFWVGERMESFLVRPLATLAPSDVALARAPGVTLWGMREGGAWEAHGDAGDKEVEGAGAAGWDGHVWLDPENAAAMAVAIAEDLSARDPANVAAYRANATALVVRLRALDRELALELAEVRRLPFIVFHDAYQYFERRYGLSALGSIVLDPEQPPGSRRLAQVRGRLAEARCVFHEPGAKAALFDRLLAGSSARQAELDPEGLRLSAGPELYFDLMRGLARGLKDCLAG